jgi:hypothetical protein
MNIISHMGVEMEDSNIVNPQNNKQNCSMEKEQDAHRIWTFRRFACPPSFNNGTCPFFFFQQT